MIQHHVQTWSKQPALLILLSTRLSHNLERRYSFFKKKKKKHNQKNHLSSWHILNVYSSPSVSIVRLLPCVPTFPLTLPPPPPTRWFGEQIPDIISAVNILLGVSKIEGLFNAIMFMFFLNHQNNFFVSLCILSLFTVPFLSHKCALKKHFHGIQVRAIYQYLA